MPWGHECRSKLIKQRPMKLTKREHPIRQEEETPGPGYYEPPKIYGGPGYSHIRRAPAYSFGHLNKQPLATPVNPNAPMFNIRHKSAKGTETIPGGVMTPRIEVPPANFKVPGPGAYAPRTRTQSKRPPAYSIRCLPRKPHRVIVEWTPPPNMYLPPMTKQATPAYSFGYPVRELKKPAMPGPGEHNPNFKYIERNKPSYSLGGHVVPPPPPKTPPPNIYCEKKFMVNKPTTPAPSFGIKHSPYLGRPHEFLKTSRVDLQLRSFDGL